MQAQTLTPATATSLAAQTQTQAQTALTQAQQQAAQAALSATAAQASASLATGEEQAAAQQAANASPTQTTTYNVTATNGSCNTSASMLVEVDDTQVSINVTGSASVCNGSTVTLTSSSAQSYQWLDGSGTAISGATNQTYEATTTGNYSVRVITNVGCTLVSAPVNVTINPNPTVSIAANTTCYLNLTASPAAAATYVWTLQGQAIGTNSGNINATSTGSYNVVVADINGCSGTSSYTVLQTDMPPLPTITASGNTAICFGSTITLTASSASYYVWFYNGIEISSTVALDNGITFSTDNSTITVQNAGSYTVVTTNANGCASAQSIATAVTVSAPQVNITPLSPTVGNGSYVLLTASSPTNATISWNASNGFTNPGNANQVIHAIPNTSSTPNTTTYTVTATDENGCTAVASSTVQLSSCPPLAILALNDVIVCAPQATAAIGGNIVNGTGNYSYYWPYTNIQLNQNNQAGTDANFPFLDYYVVELTNASNGCLYTDVQHLIYHPTISTDNLSGNPAQACGVQTYTSPDGTIITLNSVDDDATVASLAGSNTLTFDWHAYNENYGGFMNFTLMYADGFCQQDATFEVLPCCPLNNIAINGNISAAIASLILKFGAANVFTTGNTLNVQNAAFTIDRDLTIDINTHFKNCKIAVSNFIDTSSPTATSIIVQNTKSFTVDATQIKACNDMWAGINCKFSSANYSNTINNINVINNSKIQDAARGVWATGGAKVTINNSVLDRNFIHLALENYYHPNTTYPVTLNGNVFECTHPLRPNLLMNDANINLSTLSTPSKTKRGIYMNKVYNATLGNPTQIAADINSTRNYIKKCLIGIETKLSGLTLYNFDIGDMYDMLYGILGNNMGAADDGVTYKINNIGADVGALNALPNNNKNYIHGCGIGIKFTGKYMTFVRSNVFYSMDAGSILIDHNPNGSLLVHNNKFINFAVGVHILNNGGSFASEVHKNEFKFDPNLPTPSLKNQYGVWIENVTNSDNWEIANIYKNNFYNTSRSIWINGKHNANIYQNYIEIPYNVPGSGLGVPNMGILVENSSHVNTYSNHIKAMPEVNSGASCDYGCDGIRYAVSSNNDVKCNLVQDRCDAILFLGPNPDTEFLNNEMNSSFRGVYLDGTNIGTQGTVEIPQDNKWTGTGFINHIQSDNCPPTNQFWIKPLGTPNFYPNGFSNALNAGFPLSLSPTLGNGTTNGCNLPVPENPNEIFNDIMYDTDSDPSTASTDEKLNQEAFYKMIVDNPALITNADIQAFKDSMAQQQLGKIDAIKRDLIFPLDSVKYSTETNRNNQLAPLDVVDSLYKEVFEIALSDAWLHKEAYTQTQIDRLREIAWMCPTEKGRAVYASRVLLSYVDMPYVDYRNDCENVQAPKHNSARMVTVNDTDSLNLVKDGSFEDYTTCPYSGITVASLPEWASSISGRYFNECSNQICCSIPQNRFGYEKAADGIGYTQINTFDNALLNEERWFLVGNLKSNLIAGNKYRLNFKMSLFDSVTVSCKNIAVYFCDTIPNYYFDPTPPYQLHWNLPHQPELQFKRDLTQKLGWTMVDTTYFASGYEKHLIIGNFLDNAHSDTTHVGGNPDVVNGFIWNLAAYYFDDVHITLLDGTTVKETTQMQEDVYSIYPNPNNGTFTIQTSAFDKQVQFVITNAVGQEVDNIPVKSSSTIYKNSNLTSGIYFYTAVCNGVVINRGKFMVQK